MKLFNDFYMKARGFGKRTIADQLTQKALSEMKPGQKFVLASINGCKYFQCIEPPKSTTKLWIEELKEQS